MTTILDYARLCEAVYEKNPSCDDFKLVGMDTASSGLVTAIYTSGNTYIVAFKGTSGLVSMTNDVFADVLIGAGVNTAMFPDGERIAEVYSFKKDANVVLTGHSLGGGIAQVVGNRRGLPFVTFNAPGVALFASRHVASSNVNAIGLRTVMAAATAGNAPGQAWRDVKSAFTTSKGINYRLSGDQVSNVGLHYGSMVTLPGTGDFLEQHGIGTFKTVLEKSATGKTHFPI